MNYTVNWSSEIQTPSFEDALLSEIQREFGVPPNIIKGPKRDRKYAEARHIFCRLYKDLTPITHVELSEILGKRCHSTICHSLKNADILMETRPAYKNKYDVIRGRMELLFNLTNPEQIQE